MVHEDSVELAGEERSTAVLCFAAVAWVVLEEFLFGSESGTDELPLVNVTLTTVDDGNIAEAERNDTTGENVDDIGTSVHEINFCKHTYSAGSFGVDFTSKLETIRVGQIRVGGSDCENDGVGLGDELENHVTNLTLDVPGLVTDRDLGETGKIDKGQGENIGTVDAEVDGLRRDASILPGLELGIADNLFSDFLEIVDLFARKVKELSPLVWVVGTLI